jgi:hypothetical protein
LRRRRHREVELQRVGQQEDTVDGRAALEVGELHGVFVFDELPRPVVEHLADEYAVGDAEGEIQVGVPVAADVDGKRAHRGPGDGALILVRKLKNVVAESIPLLDAEHGRRF